MADRKELKQKIAEIVGVDPAIMKEYTKLLTRAIKHGDYTIVNPKKKPVSTSHKKGVQRSYYQRVKDKKKAERDAQQLALGIQPRRVGRPAKSESPIISTVKVTPTRGRGRPKKVSLEILDSSTNIQQ